jgi:hypothetical protein
MPTEEETRAANKAVVVRFNKEVIEQGNESTFRELIAPDFVNRSAPPGAPTGPEGMLFTFNRVLRPAFPDLSVEIHDQVAEGDIRLPARGVPSFIRANRRVAPVVRPDRAVRRVLRRTVSLGTATAKVSSRDRTSVKREATRAIHATERRAALGATRAAAAHAADARLVLAV